MADRRECGGCVPPRIAFLLILVALLLTDSSRSGAQDRSDVRVLQSDNLGVVVEYTPVHVPPSKVTYNGVVYTRYSVVGSEHDWQQTRGAPEIPVRSIPIRFPDVENNKVEIVGLSYEDVSGVFLPPVPDIRKGEIDPIVSYRENTTTYSRREFLPVDIASLVNVRDMHGEVRCELFIVPYQYNAADRLLRKFTRVVVRVSYGSPTPPKPVRSLPNVLRGFALNDNAFVASEPVPWHPLGLRSSVLSAGPWFRFPITEDGIYKLTGQTLLNAGIPSSTDPHTIRIFGNGGFEVPMAVDAPYTDDLLENAISVVDAGTPGQLDPSDYIVFYGKGTRGWKYTPGNRSYHHYLNHFTETNIYWLTYGGARSREMTQVPSLETVAPYRPSTVTGMLFREDEKVNYAASGLEWFGQTFNPGGQITYVHPLPGIDVLQPISYRFGAGALASSPSTFAVYEHGVPLVAFSTGASVGDYPPLIYATASARIDPNSITNFNSQSQLQFRYSTSDPNGRGYLDSYEIFYSRFLQSQNDVFNFHAQDTDAVAEYDVSGFSGRGSVFVFDVAAYDSAVWITNPRISGDTCSFQVQLASGSSDEFFVVGPGGFRTPGTLSPVSNQNLHRGDTTQAQYIIITHPDFLSAAQRLKAYREQAGTNALRTLVVDINQVYNEFGGGLLTPVAIRNFLRYAYTSWSVRPKYVLLLGDGDYDYRRILGEATPNWIPPWESPESFDPLRSIAIEDAFVTFNLSGRPDSIGLGRLTVQSLSEANTVVDKIIEYEANPVRDPWRLQCTFVADDDIGDLRFSGGEGLIHTADAEAVSNLVPSLFEKRKIYSYEYPTISTTTGRRKPTVNQAIDDRINMGTLVLNFNGHGNPRLWTHEAIFVQETDFPLLHNQGKYFFLVAATCNYSDFDMLNEQSGGEQLVSMPNAGAVAVFSADRPVYRDENRELNLVLYRNLFQLDSLNRLRPQRMGDVVFRTKRTGTFNLSNDLKYFLLGDPALVIGFPQLTASIDSVNNAPTNQVAQLKALGRVSVSATVHDRIGTPSSFNGRAQVSVFDANRTVNLTGAQGSPSSLTYTVAGDILFRGEGSVTSGLLTSRFVVPKDISYRDDYGRISLYAWSGSTDGAGFTTNVRVGGSDSTAASDVTGPQIRLFIDSRSFHSGDVVAAAPKLLADLFDSSGINTSGAGIGHRLEAWLDDSPQSIDLSDYYRSKLDTYQEGTIEYPLGTLASGSHKLRLRAWDTYDNSATEETVFDVMTGIGLQLSNVFNYPNPFSSATLFTFEHNQVSSIDAEVKIYTVAGRLIQSLKSTNINSKVVRIQWDGHDKDGDNVANGIYLYKVVAKTSDGRLASEAFGKLSVVK